jgi:prepilin peptidase CpaA
MFPLLDLALLTFPAAMVFAGSMDLLTMTIPNRISLALVAAFLLVAPFAGLGWVGFAGHVGAGALMLAIGIVMFSLGWLGGGDAKLLAAAALWMGFENLLPYIVLVGVAGGLLALVVLLYRRLTPPLWLCRQAWAMRLHDSNGGLPYGIALAGAALWIYPSTPWFTSLAL